MTVFDDNEKTQQHVLSYDKILKRTLSQDDDLTIRFMNGLLSEEIPLGTSVVWLDKETIHEKYVGIVSDFYPRIGGNLYHIELESDAYDSEDIAVRMFKYNVGGAIAHNMSSSKYSLDISFPKSCVIYLKSGKSTPKTIQWNISFFNGQKTELQVPVISLENMSVEDMADNCLFPIGQFYLRTFDPLSNKKIDAFKATAELLIAKLEEAVSKNEIPLHIAIEMQDIIRKTAENTIIRSGKEIKLDIDEKFVETLPWIDFAPLIAEFEERKKEEGRQEGSLKKLNAI
ncbi:MAG: hypothetical protein FWG10_13820 [Eubacteriaceae bacterium]|nr:hypothetical protein [Eubacteriaceae bacterium]